MLSYGWPWHSSPLLSLLSLQVFIKHKIHTYVKLCMWFIPLSIHVMKLNIAVIIIIFLYYHYYYCYLNIAPHSWWVRLRYVHSCFFRSNTVPPPPRDSNQSVACEGEPTGQGRCVYSRWPWEEVVWMAGEREMYGCTYPTHYTSHDYFTKKIKKKKKKDKEKKKHYINHKKQ